MERLDCDRMLVAVLEIGSFAAAAVRLGTSSGQASKMISRLEADLGVQLIKRTTRALSPTEVGQAYYQRIKILLDELDASVRSAAVGATQTDLFYFLRRPAVGAGVGRFRPPVSGNYPRC